MPALRWWQIALPVAAVLVLAGLVTLIVAGLNSADRDIDKRPTRAELASVRYQAAVARTYQNRRICRQLNDLRQDLLTIVSLGGRPSAATTDYYRTHPEELKRAQDNYDQMIVRLRLRNCERQYPLPVRGAFL